MKAARAQQAADADPVDRPAAGDALVAVDPMDDPMLDDAGGSQLPSCSFCLPYHARSLVPSRSSHVLLCLHVLASLLENGLLGLAPNDSPSKTTLKNGLLDFS